MPIRKAQVRDIPALQELLQQVLLVHHQARPDIFKSKGSKFSNEELEKILVQDSTPIFVFESESGEILGHLFCSIKELSVLYSILSKHFLLRTYVWMRKQEGKRLASNFTALRKTMLGKLTAII